MRKITLFTLIMTVVSTMLVAQMKPEDAAKIKQSNPLVQNWNTPYQTPPFDKIKTEDYKPAILYALDEAKKDINAIIANKEKPSFENTIVALENAGCFALVLEKIPAELGAKVASRLKIPVIGIGAGNGVDGQVLVLHDMLGLTQEFSPRFLRRYHNLHDEMLGAVRNYISDIKSKDFPNEREQY